MKNNEFANILSEVKLWFQIIQEKRELIIYYVNEKSQAVNILEAKAGVINPRYSQKFCVNIYTILSVNMIFNSLKTTSQFRHLCVQRSTIFFDAKYNIFFRLSSF